jgi:hypothetical protein
MAILLVIFVLTLVNSTTSIFIDSMAIHAVIFVLTLENITFSIFHYSIPVIQIIFKLSNIGFAICILSEGKNIFEFFCW